MDLRKVIFVDADQIVRADLRELVELDLHGAPYGYTPMGDDNTDMEGFRFWKTGYWKDFLQGLPYHIRCALAVYAFYGDTEPGSVHYTSWISSGSDRYVVLAAHYDLVTDHPPQIAAGVRQLFLSCRAMLTISCARTSCGDTTSSCQLIPAHWLILTKVC